MATGNLKREIVEWLINQSLWVKYAGKFFLDGGGLTDDLIDTCYRLFLHEHNLGDWDGELPDIEFEEFIDNINGGSDPLKLLSIEEVVNLNALASNQVITFSQQLTVIYGNNGSGKSGYIRLLNNAFVSRGDKEMLSNVFNPQKTETSAYFTFESGANRFRLNFPKDKTRREFLKISVFDSKSIKVHIEGENTLNFTPSGFDFFEKTKSLYSDLSAKLIKDLSDKKRPYPYVDKFTNDNEVRDYLLALGADSDIAKLDELSAFGEVEKNHIDYLIKRKGELELLNVADKIGLLQKKIEYVSSFQELFKNYTQQFSVDSIDKCKKLLHHYLQLKQLVAQEGINGLKEYNIPEVGSDKWKKFVSAAKIYAELLSSHYPQKGDSCIFCRQELHDKQIVLINSYWTLLRSEAEIELRETDAELQSIYQEISQLREANLEDGYAFFDAIREIDSKLAVRWKSVNEDAILQKRNLVKNLTDRKYNIEINPVIADLNEFKPIIEKLQFEMQQLGVINPQNEINIINREIVLLEDRKKLGFFKNETLNYISNCNWVKQAEKISTILTRTNSLTAKQGELFNTYVATKYLTVFREECAKLNAPKFVVVSQRNSKASTLRQLKIEGNNAGRVLSEGEQRSISLADFLTEIRLNPNNSGVIFDDPTTSLDHERRDLIAKRLVEVAKERQVIVFTHDMVLLNSLTYNAELIGIKPALVTLFRNPESAGIVNPSLPWFAQPVSKRINYLRDLLVQLKKAEKLGGDNYLFQAKLWYSLLREGWERAVEEKLLNGVIMRFEPGIQTQRLNKIPLTKELVNKVDVGMTESSKWVHDASLGLNPTPPTTLNAEIALKNLEEFVKECQTASK